jgi:hypothetical protein
MISVSVRNFCWRGLKQCVFKPVTLFVCLSFSSSLSPHTTLPFSVWASRKVKFHMIKTIFSKNWSLDLLKIELFFKWWKQFFKSICGIDHWFQWSDLEQANEAPQMPIYLMYPNEPSNSEQTQAMPSLMFVALLLDQNISGSCWLKLNL